MKKKGGGGRGLAAQAGINGAPPKRGRAPLWSVPVPFLGGWEPRAGTLEERAIGQPHAATSAAPAGGMPRVVDMSGKWTSADDARLRERLHVLDEGEGEGVGEGEDISSESDDGSSSSSSGGGSGDESMENVGGGAAASAATPSLPPPPPGIVGSGHSVTQLQGLTLFSFRPTAPEAEVAPEQAHTFFVHDTLLRVAAATAEYAEGGAGDGDGGAALAAGDARRGGGGAASLRGLPLLWRRAPRAPAPPAPAAWAVLMLRSGHFAAAIVGAGSDKAGNAAREWPGSDKAAAAMGAAQPPALLHASSHRYTNRAKAGGSQSAADARQGAHKSAGATLRRYNERALAEEVAATIAAWAPWLRRCSLVVISASVRSRTILHAAAEKAQQAPQRAAPALDKAAAAALGALEALEPPFAALVPPELPFGKEGRDPRVVRPPFATARPTLDECRRVAAELGALHFMPPEDTSMASMAVQAAVAEEKQQAQHKGGGGGVGPAESTVQRRANQEAAAAAERAVLERAEKKAAAEAAVASAWEPSALFRACAAGDAPSATAELTKVASAAIATASEVAGVAGETSVSTVVAEAEAEALAIAACLSERAAAARKLATCVGAGATLLHAAAAAGGQGGAACVTLLLAAGANPATLDYRQRPAYFVCGSDHAAAADIAADATAVEGEEGDEGEKKKKSKKQKKKSQKKENGGVTAAGPEAKAVQDAFRLFRGLPGMEERFDWRAAGVPEALTAVGIEAKAEAEAEKRRRKKAAAKKNKQAKKAAEAEAQRKAVEEAERKVAEAAEEAAARRKCDGCGRGMPDHFQPFEVMQFRYCSSACVQRHKRVLAVEAAEKRAKKK